MTGLIVSIAFDVIVALLLAFTIGLCWKLNNRIKVLQDSKSELARLIGEFDESTTRATDSIMHIQTASKLITETMQARLEKANYLADDLSFMIEKGSKLVNQLDPSRARATPQTTSAPPSAPERPRQPQPQPQATRSEPVMEKPSNAKTASAALEAMLGKIGAKNEPSLTAAPETKPRSKAEQELLDALKSGRQS